ncbi:MAG TPA: PHP domain-containing protein [Spirochaetia bacterium]|nr:PHP domain-containing protein [Spirochaetia bacterium]
MEHTAISQLNAREQDVRCAAAREVGELIRNGALKRTQTEEVNNHVHTIYSFSPYSPAMAAFKAWEAGLLAVGLMDHDSIAGGHEMQDAAQCIGIASTTGCEIRVNFSGTAVEGLKINNPDSENIAYIALHGVPERSWDALGGFLVPIHEARNKRNRAMVEELNARLKRLGVRTLDFDSDVYRISEAASGGSITERHILSAASSAIIESVGRGRPLVNFLTEKLSIKLPKRIEDYLLDLSNPHERFDLLGVLKSSFLPDFFIQPSEEECPSVFSVVDFANSLGALPAYAYLGDITESPTGDKKAEKFEDGFLDVLFPELKRIGFRAVTYMPPRNTREQLERVKHLCSEFGLMEISGVDINSSRQSFNCPEVMLPEFRHLVVSTWALIAHEKCVNISARYGICDPENDLASLPLPERIRIYASIGRELDPREKADPEKLLSRLASAKKETM